VSGPPGTQRGSGEVPLRAAATVMLVRDAPPPSGGSPVLEVLMVRRNLNSDFVGGAYIFPGGSVDLADGGAEAEACCQGRSDAEASELLGIDAGGLAYWVAVLRECFEEAGVLLAYGPDGDPVSFADPDTEARFAAHRRALNAGEVRFLDLCRDEGLRLAVDRVHYFSHWITPEGMHRRYDTRFFVAAAPADQTPAHDDHELIAEVWLRPSEALRRHREGELEIIFPTIRNLQAVDRFATSDALLEAAATAGRIPVIQPHVVADGRGVRIVLPGDPGYDEAVGTPSGLDPDQVTDVIRAVSQAANQEPGPGR